MYDMEKLEQKRKRFFFKFCASIIILCFVALAVVDYLERQWVELILDLLVVLIMSAALFAFARRLADDSIYRAVHLFICLCFLPSVAIGAGEGTVLYWALTVPLMFFFFFGKREGLFWAVGFYLALCFMILLSPFFGWHEYDGVTVSRFFMILFVVTAFGFGFESSRHSFAEKLDEKNRMLMQEKLRLELAMKQIKTLSGLIPICSNCKKVRNDDGFWQQVEEYVRDHTDADFSHGICPDCAKKLYPDLKCVWKK